MKKISLVSIALSLCLLSCTKEYFSIPFKAPVEKRTDDFNWCNDKISCYGDSFTEGPGGWPYPMQLAGLLGKDSIISDPNLGNYLKNGSENVFNGGVAGQTSIQIRQRFLADNIHKTWAQIIWAGANNAGDTAQVAKDIEMMVSSLNHRKFIIIGILNGDWPNRWKGTAYYANLTSFNERMARKYANHFIDLKTFLQEHAQKNPVDSMCLVHDITPTSLRLDELHLSPGGNWLAAVRLKQMLTACN